MYYLISKINLKTIKIKHFRFAFWIKLSLFARLGIFVTKFSHKFSPTRDYLNLFSMAILCTSTNPDNLMPTA